MVISDIVQVPYARGLRKFYVEASVPLLIAGKIELFRAMLISKRGRYRYVDLINMDPTTREAIIFAVAQTGRK